MTTYTPFVPRINTVFAFQPTLDGQQYNATVTWNAFGQRWYLNLYTQQQVLVLSTALEPSPNDYDINMVFGYFQVSTLVFRDQTQNFEVTP